MKYKIIFNESVLLDYNDNRKHYDKISVDLGNRLHSEFWNKIDCIKKYPLHHPIKYKQMRIANLKFFPFSIHFNVKDNIIQIYNIKHYKQFY
jgi:hypothetical protein